MMGSSCSSLRKNGKKDRERAESRDHGPPLNGNDERKNSGRSVDSLPYGKSSPQTPPKSSQKQSSSQSEMNGETQLTDTTISIKPAIDTTECTPNVNTAIDDSNLLVVKSTAPSPCPSTPSPYTTPSSRTQPSLSPTGLPDLSLFSEDVRALLIGSKIGELKLSETAKELYVYICGTYFETELEKSTLMDRVFPKIRNIYSERGYSVTFVDMHWDVYDNILDYNYRQLCLDTLKTLSLQNQLIVLIILTEKLGLPPLPYEIIELDFENVLNIMNDDDKVLFNKWYAKDENAIPVSYVLQPISVFFPSVMNDWMENRQECIKQWNNESMKMKYALSNALISLDESLHDKYLTTILDDEINRIIFGEPSLAKKSLLVQRNAIQTSTKSSSHSSSLDLIQQNRFERLKILLDDNLPDSQKLVFQLNCNYDESKAHLLIECEQYLEDLSNAVIDNLKKLIENVIEEEAQQESQLSNPGIEAKLHLELIQQAIACNSYVNNFCPVSNVLNQLHTYLCSESRYPFIISSPSGCGKSSLISKVSNEISNWLPNYSVIYRISNISSESLSEVQILRSICEQCCALYGEHVSLASQLLVDRNSTLNHLLGKVCFERPLVVMIDGLDRVGPCDLDWLPDELPMNMKLILTFRDDSYEFNLLQTRFNEQSFLPIPKLTLNESFAIIDNKLSMRNRKITDAQRKCLELFIHQSSSSLNAHILASYASQWHSITNTNDIFINKSIDSLIEKTFVILEGVIGAPVLSFIFGLLASCKVGLSDSEVIDLLTNDQSIRQTLYSDNNKIAAKSYPFLIWCFVKKYLEFYLISKQIKQITVISWRSDYFKDLSLKYLDSYSDMLNHCRYSLIAYFSNNGAKDKLISVDNGNVQIDQYVSGQQFGSSSNARKVDELPYLVFNDDEKSISSKSDYLLNHEWLYYKFCDSDPVLYLEDIKLYLSKHVEDKHELEMLANVIRASGYPLRYDGSQIMTQIYCRLWEFFQTPTNANLYPKLYIVFEKSSKPFITSLLPFNTQIIKLLNSVNQKSPEKSQFDAKASSYTQLFSIKDDNYHVIAISSESDELTVWSIYEEKSVRTLTGKGISQPKDVKMIDRYRALVLCNRELKIYNLDSGTVETKLKGVMNQKMPYFGLHGENYVVALSRNRMYVNLMNLNTGDLETTFKVGEDRFLNSLLVSVNGNICVCGDETQKPFPLLVWDLNNRKLLYDLRIPHHEFITRLSAISSDGHYVVSVCKELNTSSPNFIIVYDLQSGTLFKKWKPESNSVSIAISTQNGCVMNGVESRHVLVWDLSTGTKKYTLRGHTSPPDVLQATEKGNLFLSYDSTGQDRSIRIWTLDSGTCLTVFTPDSQISCCRLSSDGRALIIGLLSSLRLYTLLLCKDQSTDEYKATHIEPYGQKDLDGKRFDLNKE